MNELLAAITAFFSTIALGVYGFFTPPQPIVQAQATTTELVVTITVDEPAPPVTAKKKAELDWVKKLPDGSLGSQQDLEAYTPPPQVTYITNVILQEPMQEQPQQAAGVAPQPTPAAETFTEPRQMTPLEIATEIVKLYDARGTATMVNEDMVQVRLFGGKSVSADITTGWEEQLKATLNRIKR